MEDSLFQEDNESGFFQVIGCFFLIKMLWF